MLAYISSALVALIICGTAMYGYLRGVDIFTAITDGAKDGLMVIFKLIPNLIALMCAVYMLRASGALDFLAQVMQPLLTFVGIPKECAPLVLLRPITGSGALAAGSEIIKTAGPDSFAGRVAAIMLGASETTFYTIAVYFGGVGITKTRHTVAAALIAEFTAFVSAAWAVRLFF